MKRAVKSGLERIPFFNHPLVDRLIPDKFRDSSDFDEVRARVLIVSVLAIWGWGPVFAIFHAVEGRLEMAGASLLAALMITPIPFILRWTGSFAAAANLISLTVWLVLAYLMPYSGGLTSPLMLWLILVPLVPYIFDLKKSFWFWMALSLLTPVGLYVAESSGYAFATSLSEESLRLWWLGSIVAGIIVIVQLFALNNVLLGWLNERMQVREDEKRRAERKLQTTRERAIERVRRCMRTLIRRMPDGVLIFRDGRVVHSNAAFRRMLGRGESDRGEPFEGEPIAELVDSQQREQWLEVIDKVESGEELPYTEFDLRGAGGEVVSVEATGFRGMYGGDPVGFLLLRDLTERRELQSKMMQMDRMIAVGTLAAGVAHEINNPLSS
ncbi:MAG: PAS domain S-box protein, partial [Persicimonas sp.]